MKVDSYQLNTKKPPETKKQGQDALLSVPTMRELKKKQKIRTLKNQFSSFRRDSISPTLRPPDQLRLTRMQSSVAKSKEEKQKNETNMNEFEVSTIVTLMCHSFFLF